MSQPIWSSEVLDRLDDISQTAIDEEAALVAAAYR